MRASLRASGFGPNPSAQGTRRSASFGFAGLVPARPRPLSCAPGMAHDFRGESPRTRCTWSRPACALRAGKRVGEGQGRHREVGSGACLPQAGKPNSKVRGDLSACERTGRRDSEALHPRWGVLYKPGVYARNVLSLTLGDLPVVPRSRLRAGRPALTGREKSAEGKAGGGNESGRTPDGLTSPKARTVPGRG